MSSNISKTLGDLFTGTETSFANMINSITSQIIRMMTTQMVQSFFSMLGGLGTSNFIATQPLGTGTPQSSLFNTEHAFGGIYEPNKPRLFNEYGTGEVDIPSHSGRVLSKQDAMNAVGNNNEPTVNKFIFLSDPEELTQELQTTQNERVIVQTMHRYGRG